MLEHPESPQHPCPWGRGEFPAQPFLPGAVSLLQPCPCAVLLPMALACVELGSVDWLSLATASSVSCNHLNRDVQVEHLSSLLSQLFSQNLQEPQTFKVSRFSSECPVAGQTIYQQANGKHPQETKLKPEIPTYSRNCVHLRQQSYSCLYSSYLSLCQWRVNEAKLVLQQHYKEKHLITATDHS